jgi:hypothetical protein
VPGQRERRDPDEQAGPGLVWVVVDGFGPTCGPFELTVTQH